MPDSRFSALSTDPRYRLPSRKEARTAVDPRFSRLFKDQDFSKKASVDRYGRKIKSDAGRKELERLYRLDKKSESKEKSKTKTQEVVGSSDESEEDSEVEEEELVGTQDPARQGGFSDSSSSEEETSDEESDEEAELAEETAGQEQTEEIEEGEVAYRIAAVNLDWDNFRAEDLMAAASSFAPASGSVEKVTIYPSQFGRERMEREEMEGPPREIFASSKRRAKDEDSEEDSDDDERIQKQLIEQQADDGDEFDTTKLRRYQLDRLRYYYAVIECDSKATAKIIYDQMDGREYLTTANFFDLRYVPDDTSFEEDTPREACSKLPEGYRPNNFKTEALTHSKVRLTWDDDDTTRKEVQRRAFSRAEMDENDLQAYIGSDSSDADSVASRKSTAEDRKAKKKEAQRQKMRAALGLGAEPSKKVSKDEPVGDMQITFTSGLSGGKQGTGVFENIPNVEESTRDRYIRKEKERKQKRKEKMQPANGEPGSDGEAGTGPNADEGQDDDPFNDPFFNDPATAAQQEKKAKKAEKEKKRAEKAAQEAEAESRRAELELLMAEDGDQAGLRHFDMRDIEKAEKDAKKKGKKGKKGQKHTDVVEDDFKVETADPRFKALFESHEYAIDPTNPRFKGTSGMKQLLEEGRKKRKHGDEEEEEIDVKKQKKASKNGDDELKGLVARLKSKKASRK